MMQNKRRDVAELTIVHAFLARGKNRQMLFPVKSTIRNSILGSAMSM